DRRRRTLRDEARPPHARHLSSRRSPWYCALRGGRLMRIALLLGVLLPVLGHAQVPDHLKCYAIKDSLLSGVRNPVKSYTADLDGLAPEPGCVIKMPAKYLCMDTTKANVQPTPPGPIAVARTVARAGCRGVLNSRGSRRSVHRA